MWWLLAGLLVAVVLLVGVAALNAALHALRQL